MILAETTVAIDYVRSASTRLQQIIQGHQAAVCGVTVAEVFAGAKTAAELPHLATMLSVFGSVPIPDPIWDKLGRNLFELRTHGIAVPFSDALIATVALENGLELWTYDKHFAMIQGVLPQLKLFQEPP